MSPERQKIPADEFARACGSREAEIVERIHAGIYDGVEEGGRWFVVPRRPVPASPRKTGLPWKTVERTGPWFTVLLAVFFMGFSAMLVWGVPKSFAVPTIGFCSLIFAALVYDALRRGKTLGDTGEATAERSPGTFWFRVTLYVFYAVILLVVLLVEAFGPRAG